MIRTVFILSLLVLSLARRATADQTVAVAATQDSFVREQDPPSNFGGGGLLCVAGASSVNETGEPRGRFDSVIKFDLTAAVTSFDASFGAGDWAITGVVFQVAQIVAPDNPLFPRGPGDFQVLWLSDDTWTEGTGTPSAPTEGMGSEITWQLLQSILATATEAPLGIFPNAGITGLHQYMLSLETTFVDDLAAGGMVSLHLVPQSAELGFTFRSRNFGDPAQRPVLWVTAAPFILGDMNCDGILDAQDVAPFALCLTDPTAYALAYPGCSIARADLNGDQSVDGRDVAGFTGALLTP